MRSGVHLFALIAAVLAATIDDAARAAPSEAQLCGPAWAELGFDDGAAGREQRPHPYGAEAEARCAALGAPPPDLKGYAAQYGAAQFLSRTRGDFRRKLEGQPLRNPALAAEGAPSALSAIPPRCRPGAARRAGQIGAPEPLGCGVNGVGRNRLELERRHGRRNATLDALGRRYDAAERRIDRRLMSPTTPRAEQLLLERQRREIDRRRRLLDFQRPPPLVR